MIALPWPWLEEMVRVGLWMTPLMVLLLLARPCLRRWIGGRGMALIWAVITVRLLVPIAWTFPQEFAIEVREVVERKEAVLGGNVEEVVGKTAPVEQGGGSLSWGQMAAGLWGLGALLMAGWLFVGVMRLWRVRTGEVTDAALLAAWAEVDARLKGRVRLCRSAAGSCSGVGCSRRGTDRFCYLGAGALAVISGAVAAYFTA